MVSRSRPSPSASTAPIHRAGRAEAPLRAPASAPAIAPMVSVSPPSETAVTTASSGSSGWARNDQYAAGTARDARLPVPISAAASSVVASRCPAIHSMRRRNGFGTPPSSSQPSEAFSTTWRDSAHRHPGRPGDRPGRPRPGGGHRSGPPGDRVPSPSPERPPGAPRRLRPENSRARRARPASRPRPRTSRREISGRPPPGATVLRPGWRPEFSSSCPRNRDSDRSALRSAGRSRPTPAGRETPPPEVLRPGRRSSACRRYRCRRRGGHPASPAPHPAHGGCGARAIPPRACRARPRRASRGARRGSGREAPSPRRRSPVSPVRSPQPIHRLRRGRPTGAPGPVRDRRRGQWR